MLVLERRSGESVLIFPSEEVDPNMTIGELFAKGPIRVAVKCRVPGSVKLAISAPSAMKILRDELEPR